MNLYSDIKKELKEVKKFLSKYSKQIILVLILAIITYSIKIFNYSISIDTEVTINNIKANNLFWLGIGRWMTVVLGKIFQYGNKFNPMLSSILIPIFLTLSVITIAYTISKIIQKEKLNSRIIYILGGLIVTSPAIAEMMNFTMMGAEVACGMFFASISLYLSYIAIYENKKSVFIPAIIFLVCGMGTYQAIYPIYITSAAFVFLIEKIQNRMANNFIDDLKIILKMITIFIVSFILCKIITKIFICYFNIGNFDYLDEQINWTKMPPKEVLRKIYFYIKSVVFPNDNSVWNYSYLFLIIAIIIYSIHLIKKETKNSIIPILCIIFILLSPFFISIITGNQVAIRTMMNYPFVIAMLFILLIKETDRNKYLKYLISLSILVTSCIQFKATLDLFYSDYIRYEEDKGLVQSVFNKIDISEELAGEDREEIAIIFIGVYKPKSVGIISQADVFSQSFFGWDSNTTNLSNERIYHLARTMGYYYQFPTKKQLDKAKKSWENLDIYPKKGSIKKVDDFILVRIA